MPIAVVRFMPFLLLTLAGTNAACAQAPAPARDAAQPAAATAKPAGQPAAKPDDPRAAIAAKLEVPVEAVKPSGITGLYEVVHGADVVFATADGRYLFEGDLYDLERQVNVSEERRAQARVAAVARVTDADTIAFGPQDARYTITVFTDIDCGYCRKLHEEIAEYNRLGIRVRYLAYPRGGPGSAAWQTAQTVWCSPDRQDALTRAKAGEELKPRSCKDSRVPADYELGRELRVRGTPGIFTARGDYIAGYLPPARMLERLQSLEQAAQRN